MKYIKTFEEIENSSELNTFLTKFNYTLEDILNNTITEYGDEESAEAQTDWYLNELKDLYENGGTLYRLVFLNNEQELNKDELGNHWTFDELFQGIYNNIEDDTKEPYLLTAKVKPKDVNVIASLEAFEELPQESEIYLDNGIPELISIEKYNI